MILNCRNLTRSQIAQIYALSPVVLVTSSDVKPMQLIDSTTDTQPAPQRIAMTNALTAHGVTNFQSFTPQGSLGHAFDYWNMTDPATRLTIGQEVINFLNANIPASLRLACLGEGLVVQGARLISSRGETVSVPLALAVSCSR